MAHQVGFVAPKQPERVRLMMTMASAHPGLDLHIIDAGLPSAELIARCAQYDILILGARVTMSVLDSCPDLRFIQLMSAGFDTFDIGKLRSRGILFANSSIAIAPAVAEHTLTLMLAARHRLIESWLSVQQGHWGVDVDETLISELSGSTIGLVGLGRIGREVATRLKGWDVKLLYTDAVEAPAEVGRSLGAHRVSLDDLLSASDVVSLHVPLNPQTRHLISEGQLRRMKATAILINTCRGPVVDESALLRALQEGWIAFAGLDVLTIEPPSLVSPLLSMPNVLVTPHIAGATVQRVKRATAFALENVQRVLGGLPPLGTVEG